MNSKYILAALVSSSTHQDLQDFHSVSGFIEPQSNKHLGLPWFQAKQRPNIYPAIDVWCDHQSAGAEKFQSRLRCLLHWRDDAHLSTSLIGLSHFESGQILTIISQAELKSHDQDLGISIPMMDLPGFNLRFRPIMLLMTVLDFSNIIHWNITSWQNI